MCAKWYLGTGAQNDVVISTSIHLARNIKQFPFPTSLSMQDKLKVNSVIKNATDGLNDYSFNFSVIDKDGNLVFYRESPMSPEDKELMYNTIQRYR